MPFIAQRAVAHNMEFPRQISEGGEPGEQPAEVLLRLKEIVKVTWDGQE